MKEHESAIESTYHPATEKLCMWLVDQGLARELARATADHVAVFASAGHKSLGPGSLLAIAGEGRAMGPCILHLHWLVPESLTARIKNSVKALFAQAVASSSPPEALLATLTLHDAAVLGPESKEEDLKRFCERAGAQYIGFIHESALQQLAGDLKPVDDLGADELVTDLSRFFELAATSGHDTSQKQLLIEEISDLARTELSDLK